MQEPYIQGKKHWIKDYNGSSVLVGISLWSKGYLKGEVIYKG